jgi:hypothetical protein
MDKTVSSIMITWRVLYGHRPDQIIYELMVEEYNKTVCRPMIHAGLECQAWTIDMIATHFSEHEADNPIRTTMENVRWLNGRIHTMQNPIGDDGNLVDDKKVIELMKMQKDQTELLRKLQKEDMASMNLQIHWTTIQQDRTESTENGTIARDLARIRCASGPADRASSFDVFAMQ